MDPEKKPTEKKSNGAFRLTGVTTARKGKVTILGRELMGHAPAGMIVGLP
jgi:hypothetical protein